MPRSRKSATTPLPIAQVSTSEMQRTEKSKKLGQLIRPPFYLGDVVFINIRLIAAHDLNTEHLDGSKDTV
jgi:hypothetical protein